MAKVERNLTPASTITVLKGGINFLEREPQEKATNAKEYAISLLDRLITQYGSRGWTQAAEVLTALKEQTETGMDERMMPKK